MTPKIEIFGQNFAHFGCFERSFLTILGVENVVIWTFSNFFSKCFGMFSVFKVPLLSVFPALKVDKNLTHI